MISRVWVFPAYSKVFNENVFNEKVARQAGSVVSVSDSWWLSFGSPRSILRIKPRMYADGLLPEATTTTPIAT